MGVILDNVSSPLFRALLPPLEDALAKTGRPVFLCNTDDSCERQADLIEKMAAFDAEGIIVCPATGSTPEHFSVQNVRMPLVFVSHAPPDSGFDVVLGDDCEAARLATDRLLALGHRRVAVVGGDPGAFCFGERLRGHRTALDEASVTSDPSLVRPLRPTVDEGFRAARWIAELSPRPTAAICYNGSVALGLFHGLTREGLFPGRNFALIGHEDIEEASLVEPPISVTRVPHEEMGRRAAATLLERMGNPDAPPNRVVLEAELVVRGTCGVEVRATH